MKGNVYMGLYSHSVINAVESTKNNLENIDNCNIAKQKIETARKDFEAYVEDKKTEFYRNLKSNPDYTEDMEEEAERVWNTVEQKLRTNFYTQYNDINKKITKNKSASVIGIIVGIIGAILLISAWYSLSH